MSSAPAQPAQSNGSAAAAADASHPEPPPQRLPLSTERSGEPFFQLRSVWAPRSLTLYKHADAPLDLIGEGTYGSVFVARTPEGEQCALKRLAATKDGMSITSIREIRLLKSLKHPNILPLTDVVTTSTYSCVFPKDCTEARASCEREWWTAGADQTTEFERIVKQQHDDQEQRDNSNTDGESKSSESRKLTLSQIRDLKPLDERAALTRMPPQVFFEPGDTFLVFPYFAHDFAGLLETQAPMSDAQVKYYMQCCLSGLAYLHDDAKVIHRDIKPANLFCGRKGEVVIGDFGLARNLTPQGHYTNRVVTLWYRAPELLLGVTDYGHAVDLWSLGCVFAELLSRGNILFAGDNSDASQLERIYNICGTPNEANWPGVTQLKAFQQFQPKSRPRQLMTKFRSYAPAATALLDAMLTLNPKQRITAAQALQHPYFTSELPRPMSQAQHPNYTTQHHELQAKKEKRKREAQAKEQMQQQQAKRAKADY